LLETFNDSWGAVVAASRQSRLDGIAQGRQAPKSRLDVQVAQRDDVIRQGA
jgi:hypothetical protein